MKTLRMASVLLVLVISGCTIRMADFTVLSVKNSNVPAKSIGKQVVGENCVFSWLGVGWFGNEPNLKEAFARAMEAAGPEFDALTNVVLYRKNDILKNCYQVRGVAINTKTTKADAVKP